MIHVDRTAAPEGFDEAAERELAKVLDHFERAGRDEGYKFAAYKAAGVAETLNAMFNGKCAYCESRIHAIQPTDVEHYRPKGAVLISGRPTKPGYYWLAARWDNLLPSCIYCNRPNRHELPHLEGGEVQGKGNHFPLADEAARSRRSHEDHTREEPLILDPCGHNDPRDHLLFSEDGLVEPRPDADGVPSVHGAETIDILALQRKGLVFERREKALRILGDLKLIEELAAVAERDQEARPLLAERMRLFAGYLKPSETYVAMAMDILDDGGTGLLEVVGDQRDAVFPADETAHGVAPNVAQALPITRISR